MFCTECGHKNEETALFCSECGFSFELKTKPESNNLSAVTSLVTEEKKKSTLGFYVLMLLLLGVLTSLSVSMLKPSDTVLASQEFVPFSTPFPEPAENMPNLMLDLGGV